MNHSKKAADRSEKLLKVCDDAALEERLADGYLQMSHINLGLAEDAIDCDNEALALCEQNLRSVNECDC